MQRTQHSAALRAITRLCARHRRARAAACAVLWLLAGCGGGGGGGDPRPMANQSPVASFTVSSADGFVPLEVTVDASATRDPDGRIATFQWDFGDDADSTVGPVTSHTYTDTGSFTITLRVTDDSARAASTTRDIRVRGATLSGTIRIAPSSSVDSDVNDELTAPTENNAFGSAQAVTNPLRLGGFVNQPGSGADGGNFTQTGDPDDFFFVTLEGDEHIVLSIGDPSADLDLELYSDAAMPELLDASMSSTPDTDFTEDLPAPADPGSYFVRVTAVSGASNYVLSISDESQPAALRRTAKRLSDPFVAGELLMSARGDRLRRYALARHGRGMRVEAFEPAPAAASGFEVAEVRAAAGARVSAARQLLYRTLAAAREARHRGDAPVVEVNVLHRPLRQPNDTFYDQQWHYPAIGLEQAWELTTGREPGPPVVVAVVDTGVLVNHPDLSGQLLRDADGALVGFDFVQDAARAGDGDGIDADPDDPGDGSQPDGGGSFHGTHVAGTVAADSDNGSGVAGVSWGARLMPMRALGVDGGTTFDVMQAVRYAAGLPNVSGSVPPVRADIINLSLGSDFYSEAEQSTLNEARAQGVFLVASAGNDGSTVPSYPASYDGVVSVSATTISGTAASYSNFGPFVDLAAPGGDGFAPVLSTLGEGGGGEPIVFGSGFLAGTSMAAPHVAGVIALMKAVSPGMTPAEFDALLQAGALTDDAGASGRDDVFGWGVINANKAVQAALAGVGGGGAAVLSVSTTTLNFQSFTQQLEFSVSNLGSDPVAVTVTGDQPWLGVASLDTDADGLGQYRATVDRSGLPDGPHQGVISVQPDDPGVVGRTIDVRLEVATADVDADAGQHYVILIAPADDASQVAQAVTAVDGQYTFRLEDVPPGEYRLFAGTDFDNDNFICDGGEACGAYPSLSSPEVLSVDARVQPDVTDVSFTSEFRTTATTDAATAADTREAAAARPPGLAVDKPTHGTKRPTGNDRR